MKFKPEDFDEMLEQDHCREIHPQTIADCANAKLKEWLDAAVVVSFRQASADDGQFIAASRTAMPQLIEEVDRLQKLGHTNNVLKVIAEKTQLKEENTVLKAQIEKLKQDQGDREAELLGLLKGARYLIRGPEDLQANLAWQHGNALTLSRIDAALKKG
jgi:hypothetical protein